MRKALAILLSAFAIAFLAAPAEARIVVDTSAIAARGHPGFAADMRQLLAEELRKALGPRYGKSRITVRITRIRIAPYAGQASGDGDLTDRLYGVVIVPGRGPIPIRVEIPASTGGAWYAPENDQRRVYRLAEAFAGWVARAI